MLSLGWKVGCQSAQVAKTNSSCDEVLSGTDTGRATRHPRDKNLEGDYGGAGAGRQGRGKTRGDGRPR